MAYDLFSVIQTWQEVGIYGVLLPFLLIFAISFAIFEKIKIFGDKKNINIIVSLVLGLLFLQNVYLVERIQFILPKVGFTLLIFVLFLLLLGVFTGKTNVLEKGYTWIGIVVALIFLAWSMYPDEGYGGLFDPVFLFFEQIPEWVVLVAVVGGLIYLLTKDKTAEETKSKG